MGCLLSRARTVLRATVGATHRERELATRGQDVRGRVKPCLGALVGQDVPLAERSSPFARKGLWDVCSLAVSHPGSKLEPGHPCPGLRKHPKTLPQVLSYSDTMLIGLEQFYERELATRGQDSPLAE